MEVSGGRRVTTRAKLTDTEDGCSCITGKFKDGRQHPYFRLTLTRLVFILITSNPTILPLLLV